MPRGHSLAKPQRHSQEDPSSWPTPKSLQLPHTSLQAPVIAEGTLVCGRVVQPPSDRQSQAPGAHGARAASILQPSSLLCPRVLPWGGMEKPFGIPPSHFPACTADRLQRCVLLTCPRRNRTKTSIAGAEGKEPAFFFFFFLRHIEE